MQSVPITTTVVSTVLNIGFRFVVFNATFNNISFIWWWSVLLAEETGVPGENFRECYRYRTL
jgi:hypothetical protein